MPLTFAARISVLEFEHDQSTGIPQTVPNRGDFQSRFWIRCRPGLGIPLQLSSASQGQEKQSAVLNSDRLLELDGKKYLVAPRGRTQWVRNAEAAGEVTLKRGRTRQRFAIQAREFLRASAAGADCSA
jgi:hypothetical protein